MTNKGKKKRTELNVKNWKAEIYLLFFSYISINTEFIHLQHFLEVVTVKENATKGLGYY